MIQITSRSAMRSTSGASSGSNLDARLLLAAEMKIPGRLWLQFDVEDDHGSTRIRQTTIFDPAGYLGVLYWYALYPVHDGIFGTMLRGVRGASLRSAA